MLRKISVLLFSCLIGTGIFSQTTVIPVTNTDLQIKKNTILYFLPRAVINIKIDVVTEYTFPGPFNKYADKYLSIKNVPTEHKILSEISNIEIIESTEPDPNACFFLFDKKNKFTISYNNSGIITAYNQIIEQENPSQGQTQFLPLEYLKDDVVFTDYSTKRNFIGVTDTTYKVIEIDSIFQKIPIYNKTITSKDFEQKAEEAANFIIKIRKQRFQVQTAQFDKEQKPESIRIMLKELDDLEQQYLELFIGKKINIINSYTYKYIPQENQKTETIAMFHLSDEDGILTKSNADSDPVFMIFENIGTANEIDRFYVRQIELKEKEKTHGLYYRIPGQASITIGYDGHNYAKKDIVVPQCGYINSLPAKMMKNKNLKIIFDENYGSIKTIIN